MNRKNKYPETSTFHYYNANPKNKIACDCVIRALCTAMDEPYENVYRELLEVSLKCGYVLNEKKCYERYLKEKGWVKHNQPKKQDNTKYTGKEFCQVLQEWLYDKETDGMMHEDGIIISPQIIANIGGHHIVAIIGGQVWDIWNSTNKCIGNYWTNGSKGHTI